MLDNGTKVIGKYVIRRRLSKTLWEGNTQNLADCMAIRVIARCTEHHTVRPIEQIYKQVTQLQKKHTVFPWSVKLCDFKKTQRHMYIIMLYCPERDLEQADVHRSTKCKCASHRPTSLCHCVRRFIADLAIGLFLIHQQQWILGPFQTKDILLAHKGTSFLFDTSQIIISNAFNIMHFDRVRSKKNVPPEIHEPGFIRNSAWNASCDMWCLGRVFQSMYSKHVEPAHIKEQDLQLLSTMEALLATDPLQRPSAVDVLQMILYYETASTSIFLRTLSAPPCLPLLIGSNRLGSTAIVDRNQTHYAMKNETSSFLTFSLLLPSITNWHSSSFRSTHSRSMPHQECNKMSVLKLGSRSVKHEPGTTMGDIAEHEAVETAYRRPSSINLKTKLQFLKCLFRGSFQQSNNSNCDSADTEMSHSEQNNKYFSKIFTISTLPRAQLPVLVPLICGYRAPKGTESRNVEFSAIKISSNLESAESKNYLMKNENSNDKNNISPPPSFSTPIVYPPPPVYELGLASQILLKPSLIDDIVKPLCSEKQVPVGNSDVSHPSGSCLSNSKLQSSQCLLASLIEDISPSLPDNTLTKSITQPNGAEFQNLNASNNQPMLSLAQYAIIQQLVESLIEWTERRIQFLVYSFNIPFHHDFNLHNISGGTLPLLPRFTFFQKPPVHCSGVAIVLCVELLAVCYHLNNSQYKVYSECLYPQLLESNGNKVKNTLCSATVIDNVLRLALESKLLEVDVPKPLSRIVALLLKMLQKQFSILQLQLAEYVNKNHPALQNVEFPDVPLLLINHVHNILVEYKYKNVGALAVAELILFWLSMNDTENSVSNIITQLLSKVYSMRTTIIEMHI